jgi:hypothetical protein
MNNSCPTKANHLRMNEQLYDRNIPSQPLQAYVSVRPVMTKYSYMPIVDPRKPISVPMKQMPTFSTQRVFNPGNTVSPWSGFATQINVESELRNQIYALQSCSQAVYVPNSTSDLYTYQFQPNPNQQPPLGNHALLFDKQTKFNDFDPNPDRSIVGTSLFMNSTRTQIKDLKTNPMCDS